MPTQPKTQRWADLLAALLRASRSGATLEQLRRVVPGYYASESDGALERMFERDKKELRDIGVPIESVVEYDGSISRYRLSARDFYLPYLATADGSTPRRVAGDGYRTLDLITFAPDEISAIVRGVTRLTQLGDGSLAHEARMALRRLAHDLPVDQALTARELVVAEPALDADLFDRLVDAVRRRKTVSFTYHAFERDAISTRQVDPYGIAHIGGFWYLIGRDLDANGIRQFRLRRAQELSVNSKNPGTPDFAPPEDFDLWAHTRSRQAWDLGDAEGEDITVQFTARTGVTAPAIELGAPATDGDPDTAPDTDDLSRRYRVRRRDVFLRWVLGFGGLARITAPPAAVEEFRAMASATRDLYPEEVTS
jgi:predicted DNA-binding transcriptional regulator YafY